MKKLLIICDGKFVESDFRSEEFDSKYGRFLSQDMNCSVEVATDECLFAGGDTSNMRIWDEGLVRIEKEGPEWAVNSPAVLEKAADADIIAVHFSAVGQRLIDAAPKLKLVCVMRSGVENVNLAACEKRGIQVVKAPGRVSEPVADLAVGLMLNAARKITMADLQRTSWERGKALAQSKLMRDTTVGLVGFGIIGKKIAARLSGFQTKVLAYDPYISPEEARKCGASLVSLDELLSKSDIVSLHARLTEGTHHMIGARELALMKPDAIFINTARAGLCDENALVEALREHRLAYAALDVYNEEPLPADSPLLKLDNVILLPHIAGLAGKTSDMSFSIVYEDIVRFLKGDELLHKS